MYDVIICVRTVHVDHLYIYIVVVDSFDDFLMLVLQYHLLFLMYML